MSYTIEKLEKSQVKFSFDIDSATFGKAVEQAYQKTKHKFSIAGFRKGHVPRKVIEGIYGKEVFYEDAMDIVIPEAYGEALAAEKDVDVVAQPELTDFDITEAGGAAFTLVVTVKPEVKLGAYKGLNVAKKVEKITSKQVDEAVERARERQARIIDVETEAFNGNIVNIDFVGSVNGVPFEGGSAEGYDLELGSGSFIPGFEEQLSGVKAGEKRDVKVVFPEDYHAEELKGREAVFACTVNAVKIKELPDADDEFVKEISEFDSLAEYKEDIKNKLKADAEAKAEREFEDAVVDAIVAGAEIEVPDAMIETEVEDMIGEFEYRLGCQQIKLEQYLEYLNMTREQLSAEYRAQAEKSVKVRLVMERIVKDEDIEISEDEIEACIAEAAREADKPAEEFKKHLRREQVDYMVNRILSEKLMKFLKEENAAAPKAAKKTAAEKPAEQTAPVADKPAKTAAKTKKADTNK